MSDNPFIAPDRDIRPENLAAELTSVAYRLVLRRGAKGSWLELELCLWRRLTASPSDDATLYSKFSEIMTLSSPSGPSRFFRVERAYRYVLRRTARAHPRWR